MKNYSGTVSFSGYMGFDVKANDKHEALRKLYDTLHMKVSVDEGEGVDVDLMEWDLVGRADDAPYLWDVEIEEDTDERD